jgi:hypothetical protein
MLWALMKHAFYAMNQSSEECKVSGKIYKVPFGHHVESLSTQICLLTPSIANLIKYVK